MRIDDYALENLKRINATMYPNEGEDLTLTVQMLISEHEAFQKIKKIVKEF